MEWNVSKANSGTPGILWKAYDNGIFYKASTFGYEQGFIGHEAINEVIVSYFLDLIGVPHVSYKLLETIIPTEYGNFQTHVCSSEDFKRGRTTMHYEDFEANTKLSDMSQMDFLRSISALPYVHQMFFVDYCILNRDRHGANIDMFSPREFVPLYDNGLSFVAPYMDNETAVMQFEPMKDYRANNYIGSKSLYENLCTIPAQELVLHDLDKKRMELFIYDTPLSPVHQMAIWKTLNARWEYAKEVCNPKLLR